MSAPTYSYDQILDGIRRAIDAHDMPAVAGLTRLLAVQAPDKAQAIYDLVVNRKVTLTVPIDPST